MSTEYKIEFYYLILIKMSVIKMSFLANKIPEYLDKIENYTFNHNYINHKIIYDPYFNLLINHNNEIIRHFGKIKDFLGEITCCIVFNQNKLKMRQENYNLSNIKIPNTAEIKNYDKNIHLKILEKINNFNDIFMINNIKNTSDIEMIFNVNNQKIHHKLHKYTLIRCSEFMRRSINFNKNNDENNSKKRKINNEKMEKQEENGNDFNDKKDEISMEFFEISPLTIKFFISFLYGITTIFPLDIQLSYELYLIFDYLQIDNYNEIFDEYIKSLCAAYNFLDIVKVYGAECPILKKLEIKIIS